MRVDTISDLLSPIQGTKQLKVLLVDDEPRIISSLIALLSARDFVLKTAANGMEAMRQLSERRFDLVILDLQLPDFSGHEIMDFIHSRSLDCDVIVTSGATGIDAAIGALKRGAYDYLRKPYSREELLKAVDNAELKRRLKNENRVIGQQLENSERMYRNLVDSSPDLIYTLDDQGRFTFVNERVQQLLGFDTAELLGRHYFSLVHEQDIGQANYVLSEVRENPRVSRDVELRLKSRVSDSGPRTFNHELITFSYGNGLQGTHGVARDITDRKRADELIIYQAYHDILTELPNRVLFKDRLELSLLQAKRYASHLAVLFIDLDRFKIVNDTLGHSAGDELLRQVAARLKGSLRACDTLARIGGDEFTVVLPELSGPEDAARIAEKFTASLRPPFLLEGQSVHISGSIGIAVSPMHGTTGEALIKNADVAMYHRKSNGKNGHSFFAANMLDSQVQKIALERDLHLAMERGELEMYYQPQVDVHSGKIVGAEALMRWNHPQRGFLGAGEFLPFAEESGLMIPMTDWMLEAICLDLVQWNAVGLDLKLSFNLSPQYLERGDFFDKLQSAISRHKVNPAQLEVEVTENICIRNPHAAIEQLEKLCQLGVHVAIDDFGTGYSSLSYLHRFPIQTLKIDRSFVMEIQDPLAQFPVVLAIISIAKGLGLKLVAEGVETQAQEIYLQNSGCSVMQGFRYHRPISRAALFKLLA